MMSVIVGVFSMFQILTNCLWYITNQHLTINNTAVKRQDVKPVPAPFEKYQGYNEYKRKKVKSQPLDQTNLHSHGQALYSILNRPIFKSSQKWPE